MLTQSNTKKCLEYRIDHVDIPNQGLVVHLKGYGFVRVFRTVLKYHNATRTHYCATDDLEMRITTFQHLTQQAWAIETYHHGIKQFCGIERCQARLETSQRIMYCSPYALSIDLNSIASQQLVFGLKPKRPSFAKQFVLI